MKLFHVLLLIPLLAVTLACPANSTKQLATASDAVAHGLLNADNAVNQALASGVVTQEERDNFHGLLVKASQSGLELDKGIRANESAATISAKVNSFLDAFNALNTSGVAGIKNPNTQLAVSTILTGAETSVAIIAAAVGR
jgi:hypothetical protein